jgi:hypothetical protein
MAIRLTASRRRGASLVALGLGVLPAGAALAQTPAPAAPTESLPAVQVANACPVDPQYQEAFTRFAEGNYPATEALLQPVLRQCPSHPYASELLRQTRLRVASGSAGPTASNAQVTAAVAQREEERRLRWLNGPEENTDLARGELVVVQALHGAYQGALTCNMIAVAGSNTGGSANGCDLGANIASYTLGAGLFGAGAFLLTNRGIRPGQATVINSGTIWGIYDMVWSLVAANVSNFNQVGLLAALSGGGLLGTGAGVLLAMYAPPTSGHVGLTNSFGFWTGFMGFMFWAAGGGGGSSGVLAATALLTANLGLGAGAAIGSFYRVSRGRVLLADLSAILGGGLGAGLGALGGGAGAAWGAGFGVAVGFGLGLALTHGIDNRVHIPVQTSMLPMGPYGTPGVTLGLQF